jgi:hypothetical protein
LRKWRSSVALSPGAMRKPLTPSVTTSGIPPTAEATTGTPAAIASASPIGKPSRYDGSA